jgi:hypothetical protein
MVVVAKQNGKLPFWKVFTTFLLSQNALLARGVNAQNDETEGTTTEITINRAIEIGKLSSLSASHCSHCISSFATARNSIEKCKM